MGDNLVVEKERVKKRREEARIRYEKYQGLSSSQKLELIRSRRGGSKKEEAKILKTIKENNND